MNKKRVIWPFEDRFLESFGMPERNATWFIWGNSGNGKTRLLMELTKYLTNFGIVDYNSFEEGDSESVARACRETDMHDVEGKWRLLDMAPMDLLEARLKKARSAQFAVIDSVQYSGISYKYYKHLKESLRKKSLLFISHAKGFHPDGYVADKIRYDSGIKIHVHNFIASVRSRYGGQKPFVIWEEGARMKWGKRYKAVVEGRYWPGQF